MTRSFLRSLACAIVLCLVATATAFADDPRPTYYIELVAGKTPGDIAAVVHQSPPGKSERTCASVAELKDYLGTLPPGTSVTWHSPPNPPTGYQKFAAEWPEVQKFCAEKKVEFTFTYSAF